MASGVNKGSSSPSNLMDYEKSAESNDANKVKSVSNKQKIQKVADDLSEMHVDMQELEHKEMNLETDVSILTSVVIKLIDENECLKKRLYEVEKDKLKKNVVILNLEEVEKEPVLHAAYRASDSLGIPSEGIVEAYRVGAPRAEKTRPFVIRFNEEIIASEFFNTYKKVPFKQRGGLIVFPEQHSADRERRERLNHLANEYKIKGLKVVYRRDHILVNNEIKRDTVVPPSLKQVLRMDDETKLKAYGMDFVESETIKESDSEFKMVTTPIKTINEARNAYMGVKTKSDMVEATHLISAYILPNGQSSYQDDGDLGMGKALVRSMEKRKMIGTMCFIGRKFGGTHIGTLRFRIVNQLVEACYKHIKEDSKLSADYEWLTSPTRKKTRQDVDGSD